jgi:hypothetical protein
MKTKQIDPVAFNRKFRRGKRVEFRLTGKLLGKAFDAGGEWLAEIELKDMRKFYVPIEDVQEVQR